MTLWSGTPAPSPLTTHWAWHRPPNKRAWWMFWRRWAQPQGLHLSPSEGWPASSQVSGSELNVAQSKPFQIGEPRSRFSSSQAGPTLCSASWTGHSSLSSFPGGGPGVERSGEIKAEVKPGNLGSSGQMRICWKVKSKLTGQDLLIRSRTSQQVNMCWQFYKLYILYIIWI